MLPQGRINYLDCFPQKAETGTRLDWQEIAREYLCVFFDANISGRALPLSETIQVKTSGGYRGPLFTAPSYVGSVPTHKPGEALTCLGALLSASLSPRKADFEEYIRQGRAYLSRINGFGVVSNNVDPGGGDLCQSFWYDLFPSILYSMIGAYRPQDAAWEADVKEIAETWLHIADRLDGDWEHIGYSLQKNAPVDPRGGMESDAAIGIAYIALAAYRRFGDARYLNRARSLLTWAAALDYNPNYEILGSFGPYAAAYIQAETGEDCHLDRMLQYVFTGTSGTREGWGMIAETWGGYGAYGLYGSTTDTEGYAFAMNTYMTAAALAPVARYAPWYAREIARYLLHVRRNAALFFPGGLPPEMQSQPGWVRETGIGCISYEGVRKCGRTVPYATGDHRLDMTPYGAWGSGVMAALFPGGGDKPLVADLAAADPLSKGKCLLIYNPDDAVHTVSLDRDVRYDILTKRGMPEQAEIPAGGVMVLVQDPTQDPYPQGWSATEPVVDAFVNVAHGKKMTVSSKESFMYGAVNAATGDWHDAWHSVDSPREEWLQVDLGRTREIGRIHIIWEYRPSMVPLAFFIDGSADGEDWTRLDARHDNKAQATFHRVSASCRYLRIVMTDKENRHDSYGVTDVQVFCRS